MAQLREKVKELRELNNMSQETLAEKLFTTQAAVSNWERGVNVPDMDTVMKIADVFGVSTDEVLGRDFIGRKCSGYHFDSRGNEFLNDFERMYGEAHPERVLWKDIKEPLVNDKK